MSVQAKICGLSTLDSVQCAVDNGADFIGLVFYPPSPRYITPEQAAPLAEAAGGVLRVGLIVDMDDSRLDEYLRQVDLDMLQLHGSETPERVADIKTKTGLQVMKAVKIASEEDLQEAKPYEHVADWLMFDAKPPKEMKNALPGGNALAFDWKLLGGSTWNRPWMLAGGLTSDNVAEAVKTAKAGAVDTSSGVEDAPGRKNTDKIRAFLKAVKSL